jgi:hypothetical protein
VGRTLVSRRVSNSSSSRGRAMTANYPESRAFTEALIDAEEGGALRAALVGMREGD